MIEKQIKVEIPSGLEARPVALFVQVASKYESSVYLVSEEKKVNAKSIMGMMSLGILQGDKITVVVDGSDEKKALGEIEQFLKDQTIQ